MSIGEVVVNAEQSYLLLLTLALDDAAAVLRENIDQLRLETEKQQIAGSVVNLSIIALFAGGTP
jgi:hypothetical protein